MTDCAVFRAYDLETVREEEASEAKLPAPDTPPRTIEYGPSAYPLTVEEAYGLGALLTTVEVRRTGAAPILRTVTNSIELLLGRPFDECPVNLFNAVSQARRKTLLQAGLATRSRSTEGQAKRRARKVPA